MGLATSTDFGRLDFPDLSAKIIHDHDLQEVQIADRFVLSFEVKQRRAY